MKRKRKPQMGFKQAMEYLLDVLCYAYYVKHDNLVPDFIFDQLERLYCTLFDTKTAPMRAEERAVAYTKGVAVVYDYIKQKQKANTK